MKQRLCVLFLLPVLLLTGCQTMLERSYSSIQPHSQSLTAREDPSALEAENYQGLVSAVLYLVTQHMDSGIVRLYNYTGDAEADLTAACLEVVQKDPLGAFAVDYIKHEVTRIVSYYEASVTITYQRTAEEMGQVVSVTGSSAIKSELRDAFASFTPVVTLRISYFSEDDEYLLSLIRQAYYDTPQSAFGLPEVSLSLYPESGIQRIVEIRLAYPAEAETLALRQARLEQAAAGLLPDDKPGTARQVYDLLLGQVQLEPDPERNSAYDALVDGLANDEGLALAYQLLCGRAGLTCTVVQGTLEGQPHFWNIVTTDSGSRHVDASAALYGLTDTQLTNLGAYEWDRSYPICRDGRELSLAPAAKGDDSSPSESAAETAPENAENGEESENNP